MSDSLPVSASQIRIAAVIGAVGLGAFLFYKIYTGRQQDDSNKKMKHWKISTTGSCLP